MTPTVSEMQTSTSTATLLSMMTSMMMSTTVAERKAGGVEDSTPHV
jgi:hypothetical protein